MNAQAEKMIAVAKKEVGYKEGRSGSVWNNKQKFSPGVPGLEWSQNQAWCHTFLSWCALQAALSGIYPRTASTDWGYAWFKQRGEWSSKPVAGALGYLGNSSNDMYHVFLVIWVDFAKGLIGTIEGNTNVNGSSQGDGVYERVRRINDPAIRGYGIPDFESVPAPLTPAQPKPAPTWDADAAAALETLRNIDLDERGERTRKDVRTAKRALNQALKRLAARRKK